MLYGAHKLLVVALERKGREHCCQTSAQNKSCLAKEELVVYVRD